MDLSPGSEMRPRRRWGWQATPGICDSIPRVLESHWRVSHSGVTVGCLSFKDYYGCSVKYGLKSRENRWISAVKTDDSQNILLSQKNQTTEDHIWIDSIYYKGLKTVKAKQNIKDLYIYVTNIKTHEETVISKLRRVVTSYYSLYFSIWL